MIKSKRAHISLKGETIRVLDRTTLTAARGGDGIPVAASVRDNCNDPR